MGLASAGSCAPMTGAPHPAPSHSDRILRVARALALLVACLCATSAAVRAGNCVLAPTGQPGDVGFGTALAVADLNGDGSDDFVVGAVSPLGGDNEPGRASVFFGGLGADDVPDLVLCGTANGDRFGAALACADLNGDASADLVIGSWGAAQGSGRVSVYFGGTQLDAQADVVFDGPAGSRFGSALAAGRDLNGDGSMDLVIGAPLATNGSGDTTGRAYVCFGGPGFDSSLDLVLDGQVATENFGGALALSADLDGDGGADLVVGAPLCPAAGSEAGRGYVFFGGPGMDTTADRILDGEAWSDFGKALACADVNGDGAGDLLVGAPRRLNRTGAVFAYFGGASFDILPDVLFEGNSGSDFGRAVSAGADLNADGWPDLVIGAPALDINDPGHIRVYHGGPGLDTFADRVQYGEIRGNAFGSSVEASANRDVNGDGLSDVLVGAPRNGHAGYMVGRAYVDDIPPPITVLCPSNPSGLAGASVPLTFEIRNAGFPLDVEYSLTDSLGWCTPLVGTTHVPIAPGSAYVNASCTVDPQSICGTLDRLHFTVRVIGCPASLASCAPTVQSLGQPVCSEVLCDSSDTVVSQSQSVARTACVRNCSPQADHIRYQVTQSLDWGPEPSGEVWLAPGDSTCIEVQTTVPVSAVCGSRNVVTVQAIAPCTGTTSQCSYGVVAEAHPACAAIVCPAETTATAGDRFDLRYEVRNCGLGAVTFFLTVVDDLGWIGGVRAVHLGPGESTVVPMPVSIPIDEICQRDDVVHATFSGTACTQSSATCTNVIHVGIETTPSLTLSGGTSDLAFGSAVAFPGDLNADGQNDFVIGAATYASAGNAAPGRASVYFGGAGCDNVADLVLDGQANGERFGRTLAGGGDLNGDGYPDLAVGAPLSDAAGTDAGRVYVYFGGPAFDSVPDRILDGQRAGEQFSRSAAVVGDVNGDGYEDLLVGAPYNNIAGTQSGRAYLYFGGPSFDGVPDLVLPCQGSGEFFGGAVAAAGDMNADGQRDFAIGAVRAISGAGRAYLYFGGPGLDASPDRIFQGESGGNANLGSSLASADFNGDGFSDLIAGAKNWSSGRGQVALFLGSPTLDVQPDLVLESNAAADALGSAACTGDLNQDGHPDMILGAPAGTSRAGHVMIAYGGPGMDAVIDRCLSGGIAGDSFGTSMAGGSDVTGDGIPDLLVGASTTPGANPISGLAYLFARSVTGSIPQPDAVALRPSILSIHESRSSKATEIRYAVGPREMHVKLEIFDVGGRRVRVVTDARRAAGTYVQQWDHQDESGRQVARGVYLLRLRANDFTVGRKIVIVGP